MNNGQVEEEDSSRSVGRSIGRIECVFKKESLIVLTLFTDLGKLVACVRAISHLESP